MAFAVLCGHHRGAHVGHLHSAALSVAAGPDGICEVSNKDDFEWGGVFQMNPGRKYLSDAEYKNIIEKIKENLGDV